MIEPTVGLAFWRLIVPRDGWIRHEVRALDDGFVIFRHWALKWGGAWAYDVEHLTTWNMWQRAGCPVPIVFSAKEGKEQTAKWKAEL
jgi:hypothetical protein